MKVKTRKKQECIDITEDVNKLVNVDEGVCCVFVKHTTASVIINENNDPNLEKDLIGALNKVFPDGAGYLHDKIDGNGGAHIKASVLGSSVMVPVKDGKLDLGKWQRIIFVEFDGPREREVSVEIIRNK